MNQNGQQVRIRRSSRRKSNSLKVSGKVRAIRTIWTFICLVSCSYHSFQVTSLYFQWEINAEAFFFPTDPIIPPMVTVCLIPSPFRSQECPEPSVNGKCLPFLRTPQKFFDASRTFEELVSSLDLVNSENDFVNYSGHSLIQFKAKFITTYKLFGSLCFAIDYMKSFEEKFYRQVDIQAMTIPLVFQLTFKQKPPGAVVVTLSPRQAIPSKLTSGAVQFGNLNSKAKHYFTYRKKEMTLLKAPYATNCRDYASEGVHGVTSREMCMRNCHLVKMMEVNGGKILFNYPVVQNQSLINDDRKLDTEDVKLQFKQDCRRQCVLIECDIDEYIAWRTLEEPLSGRGPVIALQLPSEADLKVIYKPKMTFWEYSTLFGSVFGLWFGLSVFHCEQLVEKLIAKWKKKTRLKVAP